MFPLQYIVFVGSVLHPSGHKGY